MKDMIRRLARLEAESAQRRATRPRDHGLSPEEHAAALAQVDALFHTPLADWPPGMLEAVEDALGITKAGAAP